jgi:hypothetical protein
MVDKRKPGWYVTEDDGRRYWDGQKWHLEKPAKKKKEVQVYVVGKIAIPKSRVFLGIAIFALLGMTGGVVGAVTAEQQRQEAVLAAEDAAEKAAEARERAEAERIAAAEQLEREARATLLTQVEASVKAEAEKAQSKGWIDGNSILAATCTPISGSVDDLLAASTDFECFSAYKDNGDGTQSGWFWDVTVNWDTGVYTWEMRY